MDHIFYISRDKYKQHMKQWKEEQLDDDYNKTENDKKLDEAKRAAFE